MVKTFVDSMCWQTPPSEGFPPKPTRLRPNGLDRTGDGTPSVLSAKTTTAKQ